MRNVLLILILFLNISLFSQNYIDYQKTVNRIDKDILDSNYSRAIYAFDSIYNTYDFVYANDCFKALQLCCISNDSVNANLWLNKSFIQGIPLWMIRANEISKEALLYSTTKLTFENRDSLYAIYKSNIDMELRQFIDSLFVIDQQYTAKVNDSFILFRHTYHGLRWLKNNKKQFAIIDSIIDNNAFPGERLIGLPPYLNDSAKCIKNFVFYGPGLSEGQTYFMLIHYFSDPRKDINEKLLENVKNGNMPAYQFGALNDFMARGGRGKYGDYKFYNVWHHDPNELNIIEIDKRRKSIGLNTYEQQQRNMLIERERRKNKTANSEIIM